MWGDIPVTRLHIPPRPEAVVSCGRDEDRQQISIFMSLLINYVFQPLPLAISSNPGGLLPEMFEIPIHIYTLPKFLSGPNQTKQLL
jgi:hypothetical protein